MSLGKSFLWLPSAVLSHAQPLKTLHLSEKKMVYHANCRHFRGHIPCKPHKQNGYHCIDCPVYQPIDKRILIIKLGAIGDVIRTTPLVVRFRNLYPHCKITWLTWTPEILPQEHIDEVLKWDYNAILYTQSAFWDIAVNLDKEKEAGALLASISANEKYGFILSQNEIQPCNPLALHKYLTGLFDDVSLANTKSYLQEIFEICGYEYQGEPYLMDNHAEKGYIWDLPKDKVIIGLNTGCGGRWTTRLWSVEKWIELVNLLNQKYEKAFVLLLGGEAEHERNLFIQKQSKAHYLGYFSLQQFINLVYQCDIVVTQVTMAMHIAIALGKKIVLMNNIFNPHEFELFGKGEILAPDKPCKCFYRGSCVDGVSCMEQLPPQKVEQAIQRLVFSENKS